MTDSTPSPLIKIKLTMRKPYWIGSTGEKKLYTKDIVIEAVWFSLFLLSCLAVLFFLLLIFRGALLA